MSEKSLILRVREPHGPARLSYLLATLPPQFVATYVEVVFSVATQLQADVFSQEN